ncbi:MAG: hypothetical protein ACXWL5_02375 [Candidatus Chromulinivorax sp.]
MNKMLYHLLLSLYMISCMQLQGMDEKINEKLINNLKTLVTVDTNHYLSKQAKNHFDTILTNLNNLNANSQMVLNALDILINLIFDKQLKDLINDLYNPVSKNDFKQINEAIKNIIYYLQRPSEDTTENDKDFKTKLENLYNNITQNQYNYIQAKSRRNWFDFISLLGKLPINIGDMLEQAKIIEPSIENQEFKNAFADLYTTIQEDRNHLTAINQKIDTINFILNRPQAEKTPTQTIETEIDKLISQAYFSPEMHYYLRKGMGNTWDFQLNLVTGKCINLPTVSQIINATTPDLQTKIQMLQTALQAAHLALFIAALDTFYNTKEENKSAFFAPNYSTPLSRSAHSVVPSLFSESIDFLMPNIEKNKLDQITRHITNLQQQISLLEGGWTGYLSSKISNTALSVKSYLGSWFYNQENFFQPADPTETIPAANRPGLALDFDDLNNPRNIQSVSENMLKGIIFNNNYDQRKTPKEKADLIFQQCLIAQNDDLATQENAIPFRLTQEKYLYGNHLNADTLLDTIEKLISNKNNDNPIRGAKRNVDRLQDLIQTTDRNIQQTDELTAENAYKLLQKIHKAVQTAIYINNINSWTGYVIPPKYRSTFDGVIQQLLSYDQRINTMYRFPQFNPDYKNVEDRERMAKNITYGALLGAGFATAVIADYLYPNNIARQYGKAVYDAPIVGIPLKLGEKLSADAVDALKSADRVVQEYFKLVPSRKFLENPVIEIDKKIVPNIVPDIAKIKPNGNITIEYPKNKFQENQNNAKNDQGENDTNHKTEETTNKSSISSYAKNVYESLFPVNNASSSQQPGNDNKDNDKKIDNTGNNSTNKNLSSNDQQTSGIEDLLDKSLIFLHGNQAIEGKNINDKLLTISQDIGIGAATIVGGKTIGKHMSSLKSTPASSTNKNIEKIINTQKGMVTPEFVATKNPRELALLEKSQQEAIAVLPSGNTQQTKNIIPNSSINPGPTAPLNIPQQLESQATIIKNKGTEITNKLSEQMNKVRKTVEDTKQTLNDIPGPAKKAGLVTAAAAGATGLSIYNELQSD